MSNMLPTWFKVGKLIKRVILFARSLTRKKEVTMATLQLLINCGYSVLTMKSTKTNTLGTKAHNYTVYNN